MELKDVELKVENPNQEYWIGQSALSPGNEWDNLYTDGTVQIIGDEGVYSNQSNLVKVDNATYVAIESFHDSKELVASKMEDHSYRLISSDPAETIEKVGLENIFSKTGVKTEDLSTSCIYAKQGPLRVKDTDMLPKTWK
jgi:hypothetical protein